MCSLSNFDTYVVTRIQKAPKGFTFAVKSTDPVTLFENKSDYLHVFCCPEEFARQWMENLLLARVSRFDLTSLRITLTTWIAELHLTSRKERAFPEQSVAKSDRWPTCSHIPCTSSYAQNPCTCPTFSKRSSPL